MTQVTTKITRMVCSSQEDTCVFRVLIDGIESTAVKLVSISPQWHSHIKVFPVQSFTKVIPKN